MRTRIAAVAHAEIDRLVTLGTEVVANDPAEEFVVLADPDGNEFCVLPRLGSAQS